MPRRPDLTLIEAQVAKLEKAGADAGVVWRLLTILHSAPTARISAVVSELGLFEVLKGVVLDTIDETSKREEWLDTIKGSPFFDSSSGVLQAAVLREKIRMIEEHSAAIQRFFECLDAIKAADPWANLIREAHLDTRRPGRPSSPLADLFMAVIDAHLQAQTGHHHFGTVGEVTQHCFPHALDAMDLEDAVRKRISKARRAYPVDKLLAAITHQH
jgi:hypothetical protein